jgi:aconitate hydratase
MGVLPLEFIAGEGADILGLTGRETYDIAGVAHELVPHKKLRVVATSPDGSKKEFTATCRIDTPNEVDYYQHGGILQFVLRQILASA